VERPRAFHRLTPGKEQIKEIVKAVKHFISFQQREEEII